MINEEFILSLNWDLDILEKSKIMLEEWDKRKRSFYKSNLTYTVDMAEKEHFRNSIDFWDKRLKK